MSASGRLLTPLGLFFAAFASLQCGGRVEHSSGKSNSCGDDVNCQTTVRYFDAGASGKPPLANGGACNGEFCSPSTETGGTHGGSQGGRGSTEDAGVHRAGTGTSAGSGGAPTVETASGGSADARDGTPDAAAPPAIEGGLPAGLQRLRLRNRGSGNRNVHEALHTLGNRTRTGNGSHRSAARALLSGRQVHYVRHECPYGRRRHGWRRQRSKDGPPTIRARGYSRR